jgi:hypothetical protein
LDRVEEEGGIEIVDLDDSLQGLGDDDKCELYEAMVWFGRVWHWQHSEILLMPIRRRAILFDKLVKHVKKNPLMG